jgi:hypothetical protein
VNVTGSGLLSHPLSTLSVTVPTPEVQCTGVSKSAAATDFSATSSPVMVVPLSTSCETDHPLMPQSPVESSPTLVLPTKIQNAAIEPTPTTQNSRPLVVQREGPGHIPSPSTSTSRRASAEDLFISPMAPASKSPSLSGLTSPVTSDEQQDSTLPEDLSSFLAQPLCQILLALFDFRERNPLLQESAALLLVKQGVLGNQPSMSVEE